MAIISPEGAPPAQSCADKFENLRVWALEMHADGGGYGSDDRPVTDIHIAAGSVHTGGVALTFLRGGQDQFPTPQEPGRDV